MRFYCLMLWLFVDFQTVTYLTARRGKCIHVLVLFLALFRSLCRASWKWKEHKIKSQTSSPLRQASNRLINAEIHYVAYLHWQSAYKHFIKFKCLFIANEIRRSASATVLTLNNRRHCCGATKCNESVNICRKILI